MVTARQRLDSEEMEQKQAGRRVWSFPAAALRLDGCPCSVPKTKIPKKNSAPTWRFKSRRNKKGIATAVCKWRDESNEPK